MDLVFLEGAFISNGNLTYADLVGEDFSGVVSLQASFYNTSLRHVDFSGLDLGTSDFRLADLTGANLSGASLSRVNADHSTLWPEGFDPWAAGAWR